MADDLSEMVERDCRGCHPAVPTCSACNGTGRISSPGGIVTSAEMIAMLGHPDGKSAIGTETRFA